MKEPDWRTRCDTVPDGWVRCPVCNVEDGTDPWFVAQPGIVVTKISLRREWCPCCVPSTPLFDVKPSEFDIEWHRQRGQHPGWVDEHRGIEWALLMHGGRV